MTNNAVPMLPERWLNCPRKGKPIDIFIPFKTPLDSKYDDLIPLPQRFTVSMLLDSLLNNGTPVLLWIDLTNTYRFYNQTEVESRDCNYWKLKCKGHGETPTRDQVDEFIGVIDKHIDRVRQHNALIGVHCTHGFNRTGFLICSYLVERLNISPEMAIKKFASVRPPGIYKQDYLQEFFALYEDPEGTPDAPPQPAWCLESPTSLTGISTGSSDAPLAAKRSSSDAPDTNGDGNYSKRAKQEVFKPNAQFLKDFDVPCVEQVSDPVEIARLQKQCQTLCKWTNGGFPGGQPVTLDHTNDKLLADPAHAYQVSWKADGTRYLCLLDEHGTVYMLDRDNAVFQVDRLAFVRRKDLRSSLKNVLLDGEMVLDKGLDGELIPRYLVYDIIHFEGQEVGQCHFSVRTTCIHAEIIEPRTLAMQQGLVDRAQQPFGVRIKPFWELSAVPKLLDGSFAKQVTHEIDGLIFQPVSEPYSPGTWKTLLKWKPPKLNSVDFLLRIIPYEKPGMLKERKALLFVGGSKLPYDQIAMNREISSLNGKIIECCLDLEHGGWRFLRERTDKSAPNFQHVVDSIVSGMSDPYTEKKLLELLERRAEAAQRPPPTTASSAPPTPTTKAPMSPTSLQAKPNLLAKR